jgi:putative transposase
MPRAHRVASGGVVYHVLNRANARRQLFVQDGDYQAFEQVLMEARERVGMRLLASCVMPRVPLATCSPGP